MASGQITSTVHDGSTEAIDTTKMTVDVYAKAIPAFGATSKLGKATDRRRGIFKKPARNAPWTVQDAGCYHRFGRSLGFA